MEGRRGATKAGKMFKETAAKRVLPWIFRALVEFHGFNYW